MRTRTTIERFPVNDRQGEWQTTLHRIVQTYLVHHGYCATAEAFARSTGQSFEEDLSSIKNRQRIQKLVLCGRMGEAIETTQQLYPGLLEGSPNLLFLLRSRQFVEMVNGTDSEVRAPRRSPGASPRLLGGASPRPLPSSSPLTASELNGSRGDDVNEDGDLDMMVESGVEVRTVANGLDALDGGCRQLNGHLRGPADCSGDVEMDVDPPKRQLCGGSQAAMERMLQFGRELHAMSVQLKHEYGTNKVNKMMIQEAFSLLAYADPWNSPMGYQLDPVQREPVCAALNSAILESQKLPRRPPLELAVAHSRELLKLMSKAGLGSCAFANIDSLLQ